MSDDRKTEPRPLPKELPMPRYDYQKPASGTYVGRYDEKRESERKLRLKRYPLSRI